MGPQVPTNLPVTLSAPSPPDLTRGDLKSTRGPRLCPSTREADAHSLHHPPSPGPSQDTVKMKLQPRDLQGAPPGAAYLASTPCFCPLSDPTVHVTLLQQECSPCPVLPGGPRSIHPGRARGLSYTGYPVSAGWRHGWVDGMDGQAGRCKDRGREGGRETVAAPGTKVHTQ